MIRVEPLIDVKIISNLTTPMRMAHAYGSRCRVPLPTNVRFRPIADIANDELNI
jgi:hypothetical protein